MDEAPETKFMEIMCKNGLHHCWPQAQQHLVPLLIGKTPMERNAIYYFYQNLFLLVVLTCWKRNTFQISMKFYFKKRKINLKPYFLLHLLCYTAHQWFIWTTRNLSFRIYFYIAPRRSQKIGITFFHFRHGGETHFLVLTQTLI